MRTAELALAREAVEVHEFEQEFPQPSPTETEAQPPPPAVTREECDPDDRADGPKRISDARGAPGTDEFGQPDQAGVSGNEQPEAGQEGGFR